MTVNPEKEALKELITEARETLKDLKQEKKRIDEYIKSEVYRLIDNEIGTIVESMLADITKEVKQAEIAIQRRFDNLEEDMLGGKKVPPIEQLVARNKVLAEVLSQARARKDHNT